MKTDIHPTYHSKAKITCACGKTFTVGSTSEALEIEICSNCHPFFTGKEKLIDTAGKVERFKARRAKASTAKVRSRAEKRKVKSEKKAVKTAKKTATSTTVTIASKKKKPTAKKAAPKKTKAKK